tara:strand:- start:14394 stop:14609 length:216 start_codon:yes stop_codon:yes gene_type:complete
MGVMFRDGFWEVAICAKTAAMFTRKPPFTEQCLVCSTLQIKGERIKPKEQALFFYHNRKKKITHSAYPILA